MKLHKLLGLLLIITLLATSTQAAWKNGYPASFMDKGTGNMNFIEFTGNDWDYDFVYVNSPYGDTYDFHTDEIFTNTYRDNRFYPLVSDVAGDLIFEIIYLEPGTDTLTVKGFTGAAFYTYTTIPLIVRDETNYYRWVTTYDLYNSPLFMLNNVSLSDDGFWFQKYVGDDVSMSLECQLNVTGYYPGSNLVCSKEFDSCYITIVNASSENMDILQIDEDDCSITNQFSDYAQGTYKGDNGASHYENIIIVDDVDEDVIITMAPKVNNTILVMDKDLLLDTFYGGGDGVFDANHEIDDEDLLFHIDADGFGYKEIIVSHGVAGASFDIFNYVGELQVTKENELATTDDNLHIATPIFVDITNDNTLEVCYTSSISGSDNMRFRCWKPFGLDSNTFPIVDTITCNDTGYFICNKGIEDAYAFVLDGEGDPFPEFCTQGFCGSMVEASSTISINWKIQDIVPNISSCDSECNIFPVDLNNDEFMDVLAWNRSETWVWMSENVTPISREYDIDYWLHNPISPVCVNETFTVIPHVNGSNLLQYRVLYRCNNVGSYSYNDDWSLLDQDGFLTSFNCTYNDTGVYRLEFLLYEFTDFPVTYDNTNYQVISVDTTNCYEAGGAFFIYNQTEIESQTNQSELIDDSVDDFFNTLVGGSVLFRTFIALVIILMIAGAAAEYTGRSPTMAMIGGIIGALITLVIGLLPVSVFLIFVVAIMALGLFGRFIMGGSE